MNFGAITGALQGIGDAGNQFADAKLQAYNQRIQQLMDKLGVKREQTEQEQREENLRKSKMTDEMKIQQQVDSLTKVAKQYGIELKAEDFRSVLGLPAAPQAPAVKTPFELWQKQNPGGTYSQWQDAQQEGKSDKEVKIKSVGDQPYQITDKEGKTWSVDDPALPKNLKDELAAYNKAASKNETNKATVEARKSAEAISRAIALADAHELAKERGKVFDIAKRGLSGHSFLKTVAQQVNDAEASGGVGSKPGDLMIAEGFMQLMFGVDPKALRGSPKMMEFLLTKQGGWDDQLIGEMNKAINGGQMSQAARRKILEVAQTQIESWDQQVQQTGGLVTDKQTKAITDNYMKQVSAGEDAAMKALGGTQK